MKNALRWLIAFPLAAIFSVGGITTAAAAEKAPIVLEGFIPSSFDAKLELPAAGKTSAASSVIAFYVYEFKSVPAPNRVLSYQVYRLGLNGQLLDNVSDQFFTPLGKEGNVDTVRVLLEPDNLPKVGNYVLIVTARTENDGVIGAGAVHLRVTPSGLETTTK